MPEKNEKLVGEERLQTRAQVAEEEEGAAK